MRDVIRIAHHYIVSCSDAMGLRFGLSAVWPVMRAAAMPNPREAPLHYQF